MSKSMKRSRFVMLAVFMTFVGGFAFAKTQPENVKEEEGYYYGYGKGDTMDAAMLEAKHDLVETVLTTTLRATNAKAARVKVSDASLDARLGDIKTYAQSKKKEPPAVTYRIKFADWDKKEKAYQDSLRDDLSARISDLTNKRSVTEKMTSALAILSTLDEVGETNLLAAQAGGSELLSRKVETICKETANKLVLTLAVGDGFVDASTKFGIKATDTSGKAVENLSLSVSWDVAALPTTASEQEVATVTATATTNAAGNASIDYPSSESFRNRPVVLTVMTSFGTIVPTSSAVKKIDVESAVDANYNYFEDLKSYFATVAVPAGKFNAGALTQDTRAKRSEVAREAETGAYEIGVTLVTNAQYALYLHATRASEMPEYFDNSDYNQGDQPIVGLTLEQAQEYATWLSEQTGNKYRLPTEDEYEKAARAGKDVVYPWGDDSPAKAKNANYKGNGTFKGPSPVGSYNNGKNEWGLVDMVGNVWEWTTSTHSQDAESTTRIIKGGSWMDGPTDLRISNFLERDSSKGYADVGFRLVKEVSE